MRVFVAGSSKELERAERFIARVNAIHGLEVAYDWPAIIRAHDGQANGLTHEESYGLSLREIESIESAQALVLLLPAPGNESIGMWVELGLCRNSCGFIAFSGDNPERTIFYGMAEKLTKNDDEALEWLVSLIMPGAS